MQFIPKVFEPTKLRERIHEVRPACVKKINGFACDHKIVGIR